MGNLHFLPPPQPEAENTTAPRGMIDATSPYPKQKIGEILVSTGALPRPRLNRALRLQRHHVFGAMPLGGILIRERMLSDEALATGLALQRGIWRVPLTPRSGDLDLIDTLGAGMCLRYRLLPLRREGGVVVVATSRTAEFEVIRPKVEARLGPVALAIADETAIEAVLVSQRSDALVARAESRTFEAVSLRRWTPRQIAAVTSLLVLSIILVVVIAPALAASVATLWVLVSLASMSLLKLGALVAHARAKPAPPPAPPSDTHRLPRVSLLVPLRREVAITGHLVARLKALKYPADRLDVCFIVEQDDRETSGTVERAGLPPGWRIIDVPPGSVMTKPRALNYALDFALGEIVGVYDAEDAPEADQILKVVAHFATAPPEVVCLQGELAFYNARQNWLSRCFALDYASWFRIVLPGLARMGFVIPLGGTTLFFRRSALEAMGCWDAHNVTEDADLGVRLARIGFRTELVDTVTREEAACGVRKWICQRGRWLKGYTLTWAIHMRRPGLLLKNLGLKRFLGVQVLFLGTVSLFLLAPFMWSFLLLPLGLPHPMAGMASQWVIPMIGVFVLSEGVNLAVNAVAVWRKGDKWLLPWVPTMMFYFPLGALASYRAICSLFSKPFFWDKTEHGSSIREPGDLELRVSRPRLVSGASRKRC